MNSPKLQVKNFVSKSPKIMFWDIESTSLNAAFGTILCIGHKLLGEKDPKVITILDHPAGGENMLNDKPLVEEFSVAFNACDYHATWYGKRFDLPMINTKLLHHGLKPLMPKPHLDLWETARKHFKLHSNRLAAWQQYLGTPHAKTPIEFDDWLKAAQGNRKSIKYVKTHCAADVNVLEEIFIRFRPWVETEPMRALFTGEADACPNCGNHKLQKRGMQVSLTRVYQRYQCGKCGHWSRSARSLATSTLRATV